LSKDHLRKTIAQGAVVIKGREAIQILEWQIAKFAQSCVHFHLPGLDLFQ
jgi:hypothetical protein